MTDAAGEIVKGGGSLGVGKALADARKAQGLAIADVAQQLKFMPRQLDALEHERFTSLPGPTIARGMVRSYARLLKIDAEPLLAAMAGHVESSDATPQLAARYSQPVPFADSGRRTTLLYLALSALVLGIAGALVYEWRSEGDLPEFVAAAQQPASPAPVASPPAAPVASENGSAEPVAIVPAPEPKPKPASSQPAEASADAKAPAKPKPEPSAQVAAATTAPQADGTPKSLGANRIVFRFEEEAWIEVTDGAGRLLASSLNPAGSERVLHGRPPFNLVIGNASNVKLSYNDREVDLQPHVKVEVARFTLK